MAVAVGPVFRAGACHSAPLAVLRTLTPYPQLRCGMPLATRALFHKGRVRPTAPWAYASFWHRPAGNHSVCDGPNSGAAIP